MGAFGVGAGPGEFVLAFFVGGGGFGRGRLKNRNRVRAFRAHITSELKVLCGATACFECAGCF